MRINAFLLFVAALAVIGLMLFVPAGTLDYWQAWLYIAVIFVPAAFVILYFMKNDPQFMERRMQIREKEAKEKRLVHFAWVIFIIGFLIGNTVNKHIAPCLQSFFCSFKFS